MTGVVHTQASRRQPAPWCAERPAASPPLLLARMTKADRARGWHTGPSQTADPGCHPPPCPAPGLAHRRARLLQGVLLAIKPVGQVRLRLNAHLPGPTRHPELLEASRSLPEASRSSPVCGRFPRCLGGLSLPDLPGAFRSSVLGAAALDTTKSRRVNPSKFRLRGRYCLIRLLAALLTRLLMRLPGASRNFPEPAGSFPELPTKLPGHWSFPKASRPGSFPDRPTSTAAMASMLEPSLESPQKKMDILASSQNGINARHWYMNEVSSPTCPENKADEITYIHAYTHTCIHIYIHTLHLHLHLHYITLHYNTLPCITLQYIRTCMHTYITYIHTYINRYIHTLHAHIQMHIRYTHTYALHISIHTYVYTYYNTLYTLHYILSLHTYMHDIALHYITLRYITLHCISVDYLHTSHTYVHSYMHAYIHTLQCIQALLAT